MTDETIDTDVNELLPVLPEFAEAEHPGGIEMSEWVFTNDKTNMAIRQLFHGIYGGAFANKLGLMHAKVRDSEEIATIIVGVEVTPEGGVMCHPLARVFSGPEEAAKYQAPDGNGGYL